ncbi:MAG: metalloregulator ArsR/SmtB family transcription factor [Anaerolineae bacterium]|nr:metalloregulator ArsR/SmtB family transcription factor [Anaerolineae bacterium]
MADQDFILAPATVKVRLSLEPAFNVINTLMLLEQVDIRSGLSEWVAQTVASLSPEDRRINRMIFSILTEIVIADQSWPSFPAFVDHLAAQNPVALRDRALHWCDEARLSKEGFEPVDAATLLKDVDTYVGYMRRHIEQAYSKKGEYNEIAFDEALYVEAYSLLVDPPALQNRLVTYLRMMWDRVLKDDWQRNLPMLEESVAAFQQLNYSGLTALEAARLITGRDLSAAWGEWPDEIVFVPSAHIGPYVMRFGWMEGDVTRLMFGARLPEGVRTTSPALTRSELLVRLSALADDTRLHILELLTQHHELCAQDIIEILELSQSAASRHLRQLTATGYLLERRREVAKCYTLNPDRVADTIQALKRFLKT